MVQRKCCNRILRLRQSYAEVTASWLRNLR